MDFDVNVLKFQGTLYSLGSQGLLNKSDSLPNVVEAIREVISNFPDAAKCKITFLMVLNTQLAVSDDLKNDPLVCLFTNTSSYIQKDYLINYVYYLNLQPQLFKVIENCPGALSLELLDVIMDKLKEPAFHRDEFGIKHFYQLWESVFVKICKINSGLHLNDSCSLFMTYFQKIYALIRKVLIISMRVSGLEDLAGFHLYNFFKCILHFLQHKKYNLADESVYQLTLKLNNEKADINVDYIKVCNSLIFKSIFEVLENLTIDMWLTLSECYFDFDPKNSAQSLIGGLVCSILDEVKHFKLPSNILDCLATLAINRSDQLASKSLDEIIANVKNGEQEWFPALISHHDFSNKNFLDCLLDNLHLASSDELNAILKNSYAYLCSCENKECLDLLKALFLKAVKMTPDPLQWLDKVFEKYQPKILTTADTYNEIVETFNKISVEKNVPDSDVISLCMQSPFDTIKTLCCMALCDSHQTDFVIDILKLLKKPCNAYPDDGYTLLDYVLLKFVLKELNNAEKQPFINFVVELRKENLTKHSFFINLLKTLKGCLESEMLEKAVVCLEIIKRLLQLKLFQVEEAAFLVFLSQVLGFFSWNQRDFSAVKAEGRDIAGSIAALVIGRLDNTDGIEYEWARKEILKSLEVNQAHFCDLWFLSGHLWPGSGKIHSCILALAHSQNKSDDLRKFLMAFDEPFQIIASVVTALSVVLPISSFREWDSIFNHLIVVSNGLSLRKSDADVYFNVLDMFGSALFVLTLISKLDRNMFPCFKNCLQNLGRLTGFCCPKMNGGSFLRTFRKFFLIIQTVEDENERKSCWEVFSPALMELIDWMKRNKMAEADKNAIQEMLYCLDLEGIKNFV